MKIKDGFNGKELTVRLNGNSNGHIELWINGEALVDSKKDETLSYMTLDELLELKKEIEEAVKNIFGLKDNP